MTPMIEWLASSTVTTSVVLVLLLACRQLLARRLGAQAVYLLWLAVPLGLLLLLPLASSPMPAVLPALPSLDITALTATAGTASGSVDPSTWLGVAWLAGFSAMLVHLARQLRAASGLAAGATRPATPNTATRDAHGITPMQVCDAIAGPVVVGLISPVVLLPPDFNTHLDPEIRALVLRHEGCHARRRDNLVNLFASALLAVFWFNPLAWIGMRAFRTDQELSCDAHALSGSDPGSRIGYARTLITLAGTSALPTLTSPWHAHQSIKRRIDMLNTHQLSRARLIAGLALLVLLVTVAALLAPPTRADTAAEPESAHEATDRVVPIVRVNPVYPREAAKNRVEGFVTAEFTITENGSVADIVVLESQPAGVFDQAATDALAKWRFKPHVEDGTPLPFRATQMIEFRME